MQNNFKTYIDKLFPQLTQIRLFKSRVPIWEVIQIMYAKVVDANLHLQASSMAFAFTLSLFPAILFLFSLIPFVAVQIDIPDLSKQILELLEEAVPQGIFDFVAPTIADIIDNPRTDVLSFGFVLALYAATTGVAEMMHNFNANYKHSEPRGFIRKRLIAMWIAFLFAFLLVIGVVVLLIGELVLHYLVQFKVLDDNLLYYSIIFIRYLITFFTFYLGISYVYYIAPAVKTQWRFFSLGSTLASIGAIVSTNGFSYYLSHFATYNKLYGSIGTIIALMVWFYVLAWVLLIGFAINASMSEARIAHETAQKEKLTMLNDLDEL
jgi:membrane protein